MHYSALTAAEFFGPGSEHLWQDLGLDVVGLSAWFPLVEREPSRVLSVEEIQEYYEGIFQDYLVPLAQQNANKPLVFLEFGATDNVGSPANLAASSNPPEPFEFRDENGNGIDDGQETQANLYQALLNTMARYPAALGGIFWWGNWVASDAEWADFWANQRGFSIRNRPSEDVVRSRYEVWGDWLTGGYWMQVNDDMEVVEAGAFVDGPELAGSPSLPSLGTASYEGFATGGYAAEYSSSQRDARSETHELGAYRGDVSITADFGALSISGRIHTIEVNGFQTSAEGVERRLSNVAVPYEFVLRTTSFDREGFTGEVSVSSNNQRSTLPLRTVPGAASFLSFPTTRGFHDS